ncbi:MAG: hypothetical protein WA754_18410 [Pseudolabrys sp.]
MGLPIPFSPRTFATEWDFLGRRKAATLLDETVQPIATIAPALVAGHAKHLELAGEVAEYGGAVVGA